MHQPAALSSALDRRAADAARLACVLLLLAGAGGLGAAFAAEHLFGIEPCILCFYQRIPYAIAGALGLAGLLAARPAWLRPALLAAAGLVFAAGATLAFYHVGIEQHWWGSIAGCSGGPIAPLGPAELQAALTAPSSLKPCDRVDWRLFGLSLAGYNALLSLGLAAACLAAARWLRRNS